MWHVPNYYSKGLILILFCMCENSERADLIELIQGRFRNLMATVDDLDTRELLVDRNESTSTENCPGSTSILHVRLSPILCAMGSTSVYAKTLHEDRA